MGHLDDFFFAHFKSLEYNLLLIVVIRCLCLEAILLERVCEPLLRGATDDDDDEDDDVDDEVDDVDEQLLLQKAVVLLTLPPVVPAAAVVVVFTLLEPLLDAYNNLSRLFDRHFRI